MNYLNNPLNLRYVNRNRWKGQLSPKNGFCQFSSMAYGIRAALLTLMSYRLKGFDSVESIIKRFAPDDDGNDTKMYIAFVLTQLKCRYGIFISRSEKLKLQYYPQLLSCMAKMETGENISFHYVREVAHIYKIF